MICTQRNAVILVEVVGGDKSDILDVAIVAQRVSHAAFLIFIRAAALNETAEGFCTVDRQNITLPAVRRKTQLPDLPRIRTQEKVCIGEYVAVSLCAPPLKVQLQSRLLRRLLRNDIDDTADGIRAILRTRRATDDLDACNVLRPKTLQLITRTRILCKIAHHGLTVNQDERMARLSSTNGDGHAPHRVDISCHARLVKDNILNRFRLLLRDVLRRDNRRGLRFILRIFLCGIYIYLNICGRVVPPPRSELSFANVLDTDAIT